MFLAVLLTFMIGVSAGAAIDNTNEDAHQFVSDVLQENP